MQFRALACLAASLSAALLFACEADRSLQPAFDSSTRIRAVLVPGDAGVVTVMGGLNNPRGLTFAPNGALYVAEAGRGSSISGCFGSVPPAACKCAAAAEFTAQRVCYGPTGSVSRLRKGVQERVVTGLPSYANATGRAEGPNDIAMLGGGNAHVTIGLETSPLLRNTVSVTRPAFAGFGRIARVTQDNEWWFIADIGAFEADFNPDPRIVDSNPFGLFAIPGGLIVVDAGGNSLLQVAANNDVSLLAVMPQVAQATSRDAVPTSVALGPDGAYYVGVLTGVPWVDGSASVYRLVEGLAPQPFRTGFKAIIDIAFDAIGNLYVLQHLSGTGPPHGPGLLIRISADGSARDTLIRNLDRPTSVAIGPDSKVYIAHLGLSVGAGEVLRIDP
jgi:hypothetical protein